METKTRNVTHRLALDKPFSLNTAITRGNFDRA